MLQHAQDKRWCFLRATSVRTCTRRVLPVCFTGLLPACFSALFYRLALPPCFTGLLYRVLPACVAACFAALLCRLCTGLFYQLAFMVFVAGCFPDFRVLSVWLALGLLFSSFDSIPWSLLVHVLVCTCVPASSCSPFSSRGEGRGCQALSRCRETMV